MPIDATIKNDSMTGTLAPGNTAPTLTVGGLDTSQVKNNIANFQQQNGGSLSTDKPVAPTGNMDMQGFAGIVDTMRTKLAANNALADTRTKLLNVLYNRGLTADEMKTLDPSTQDLISKGDKNQIEMQIRIINDQISGRTQTLDKSVGYLTDAYEKTLTQAETAKNDAMNFVAGALKDAQAAGISPAVYMRQLYGPEQIAKLERLTGMKFSDAGVTGLVTVTIPTGTIAADNNNPGNLRFNGQTGASAGSNGFAKFTSPEAGYRAMVLDITSKLNGTSTAIIPDGVNKGRPLSSTSTLEDLIRVYAPTGDKNDPVSYAQTIAKALGITPETLLSNLNSTDLANAMIKVESGSSVGTDGVDHNSIAYQLAHGQIAPSELSKRTTGPAAYNKVIQDASAIHQAEFGTPLDPAKLDRDYKFASSVQTQNTLNYLASLTGGSQGDGNLQELIRQSDGIDRSQFPALNNVAAWTKLETGSPEIAAYKAAILEVADQTAKILQGGGTGSGTSDAKLRQAQELFNVGFTKDQIKSTASTLLTLLKNRASGMVRDNPYLSDYAEQFGLDQGNKKSDFQSQIVGASDQATYDALKKANPKSSDEELFNALKKAGKIK